MTIFTRRMTFSCSLAAVVAVASCGSTAGPAAPSSPGSDATPGGRTRIVVLGDSLAVSPTRTDNFPAELQKRIDAAGFGWTVTNAGVSGDTTAGGLRRVDDALTADTGILVLELGANDGLRRIEISTVEQNLAAIIERAQSRNVQVLLCGMETPPMNGWDYTVAFHGVFPRVAAKYRVPLVPFLLAGVALVPDMNGPDEIHPNAAGARRIAETVWPYLERVILQDAAVVAQP
jgi:acyl-CoA thioesterase I